MAYDDSKRISYVTRLARINAMLTAIDNDAAAAFVKFCSSSPCWIDNPRLRDSYWLRVIEEQEAKNGRA